MVAKVQRSPQYFEVSHPWTKQFIAALSKAEIKRKEVERSTTSSLYELRDVILPTV
jgi:hypothetical protein